MIDEMTHEKLRVSVDAVAGPYLMVTIDQLDSVVAVLDRHKVRYWVDSEAISLDNEPYVTVINFGKAGDGAEFKQFSTRPSECPPADSCPWPMVSTAWLMRLSHDSTRLASIISIAAKHGDSCCNLAKGRPVGIVDLATKRQLPVEELEAARLQV